jgi:phosphoglycerate dehydrogenase-like enzyme
MTSKLRVALTREMLNPDGNFPDHIQNLPLRTHPRVDFQTLPRLVNVITGSDVLGFDACLTGSVVWNEQSYKGIGGLCCISRWGVGYDNLDPKDCTANDVVLITTRGALDYPVAESALSYMLALSHRMLFKDRLARANDWTQRLSTLGNELREKVIGIVGLGAIGTALLKLLAPFQPGRIVVFDPYVTESRAKELGVEKADLHTLCRESDIITIHTPKIPETTNLIRAEHFKLMKPTAYLVNTARGGIVNQRDLYEALRDGRIRGAGIDVFEKEPPDADEPLLTLDNVILSPHANSLTQECFRDIGLHITRNLLKLIDGVVPEFAVNRDVLERPGFRRKLDAIRERMTLGS